MATTETETSITYGLPWLTAHPFPSARSWVLDPHGGVPVAYEMNGEPTPRPANASANTHTAVFLLLRTRCVVCQCVLRTKQVMLRNTSPNLMGSVLSIYNKK